MDMRALAIEHGLTDDEYDHVLEVLGRPPRWAELGVISVMWSEHCSYKSSRVHLARLHTEGPRVVQGPGENAGAVDIGNGWAAVFKMESHNHPSFIEPYQGAATGVGGILRDVFTMGARPVANLNSLRFGRIDHEKTPHLFHGVVAGIAGYGNCIGVPTVGGEVYFDECYDGNILVNVFNVGYCKSDEIFRGVAAGVGNPVFYVGASTGRDGIHGATMASETFEESSEERRPTVQVGDPFREKLLLEACQELMKTRAIIGIQDMGAAGLTSSSVEMADRGGVGIRLTIDDVPMREEGMTAYEALLSESQERMLIVIRQGAEDEVRRIFDRWELEWAKVGEVIEEPVLEVWHQGNLETMLPIALLTSEAPSYDRPQERPAYLETLTSASIPPSTSLEDDVLALISRPNLCSRQVIYEQFDHMVQLGTAVLPARADAAVIRIVEADRSIAISVDCNSTYCYLDPYEGARLAVAEVTRNISTTGALPVGVTDCLNFGDPTNPEIMWQFARAIEGLRDACIALQAPIVSGNVSLYNATLGRDIHPTPTVAAVGSFDEGIAFEDGPVGFVGQAFQRAGDLLYLLGSCSGWDLEGSEYACMKAGHFGARPPSLDIDLEVRLQALIRDLVRTQTVSSAHDCSEGGLILSLLECLFTADTTLGCEIQCDVDDVPVFLFSEAASRIVVSIRPEDEEALVAHASEADVPVLRLGCVDASGALRLGEDLQLSVEMAKAAWSGTLEKI